MYCDADYGLFSEIRQKPTMLQDCTELPRHDGHNISEYTHVSFLGFGLSVEFHMVYILCGHWRTKEGGSNIVYKLCVTTITMATQTGLYQFNISSYFSMLLV